MNGTMSRWLRGVALLSLGLALGITSVGCVTAPDEDPDADVDDETGIAAQELDGVEEAPAPDAEEEVLEDPGLDDGAVDDDSDDGEPQPVPWMTRVRAPFPDDIDPFAPVSCAPSNSKSGKSGK